MGAIEEIMKSIHELYEPCMEIKNSVLDVMTPTVNRLIHISTVKERKSNQSLIGKDYDYVFFDELSKMKDGEQ